MKVVVTGIWPDVMCGFTGVTARQLLKDIDMDARDANRRGELSDADYQDILDHTEACRKSKSLGGDDIGHCAYVMKAKSYGRQGAWILCAKTLELGHM